jgi:hypothetical protein
VFTGSSDEMEKFRNIVNLKLTQIMHDMISFEIEAKIIKEVIDKYLNESRILDEVSIKGINMMMDAEI